MGHWTAVGLVSSLGLLSTDQNKCLSVRPLGGLGLDCSSVGSFQAGLSSGAVDFGKRSKAMLSVIQTSRDGLLDETYIHCCSQITCST